MPVNKKLEQEQLEAVSAETLKLKANLFRKRERKAQGTRFGTLSDWREGSLGTGEIAGRYGRALRDGR